MRLPSTTDAYVLAWRHLHKLPDAPVRGLFHAVADICWLLRLTGVRQLEANLARLRPDLPPAAIRSLSRRGMRSYLRYFCEVFQLRGWSKEQTAARVRGVGHDLPRARLQEGTSAVLALGHNGNWDLAGAWASQAVGPVLSVAEKLPDGLYEEFVSFRKSLGIEIIPVQAHSTFRTLMRAARTTPQIVPLLADRDLTAGGAEVSIAGSPARVAVGPGALAIAGNYDLFPVAVYYERLHGQRRRAAGSPWGTVVHFIPPVELRDADGVKRSLPEVTQDWVDALFAVVAQHPEDWHMLQKLFLADLDPQRLARATGAEAS